MAGENPWDDYKAGASTDSAPWDDFKGGAAPVVKKLSLLDALGGDLGRVSAQTHERPIADPVLAANLNLPEAKSARAIVIGKDSPGSTVDNPFKLTNIDDFAALPNGAYFTGADGVLRQKGQLQSGDIRPIMDVSRPSDIAANSFPVSLVGAPEATGRGFVSGGGKLLEALGKVQNLTNPSSVLLPLVLGRPDLAPGNILANTGREAQATEAIQPNEALGGLPARIGFMGAEQIPTLAAAVATGGGSTAEGLIPAAVRSLPYAGKLIGNIAAGAPTAAALTGEQALTAPEGTSLGDIAKQGAFNLAMGGIPGAIGSSPLVRTVSGGAIGAALPAAQNYLEGKPQDAAANIVGGLTGAILAGGHAPAEVMDPNLARYQASANEAPAAPAAPLQLPAPDLASAATAKPEAPVAPAAPTKAAPFDVEQATKDFHADPRAALDALDHPTLTQLAQDVGLDVAPNEKRVSLISRIAGQPKDFLSNDVLPEYLAAAQDAHTAAQGAPAPEAATPLPGTPPAPSLGDLARSVRRDAILPVDASGTAYTPEQGALTLADAIQANAKAATRALPPAVTTVDSAGNALTSADINRQLLQRRADEQAGLDAANARRNLGITPDIERTQGPRWEQQASDAEDLRTMQEYRDAENDNELAHQRLEDAPEWWVAGQHEQDAFDQHLRDLQQERDVASQPEREAATKALNEAGIAPADHDEALTFSQLIQRALDAGAEPRQLMDAAQEPDNASRARAMWALTNRLEGERDAQGTADAEAGTAGGATQTARPAAAGAPVDAEQRTLAEGRPEAEGAVSERGNRVTAPESTDEFGTPASWVIRNKETGEPVMETFERSTAERINHDKYEAVPVAQHLAEINTPGTKQYESRGDVSRQRAVDLDNVDDFSRELSIDQGNADADRLGIREAVNKALGPVADRIQYLHGYEGLPEDMRRGVMARNNVAKQGRSVAMYSPKTGDVYIFTDGRVTPERAIWSAAHEIAGHDGLRALLGDKLDPALGIARKNPTVAALADAIYAQRNIGEQMKQAGRSHGDGLLLATEEALAELAAAVRTGNYERIHERYGVDVPPGIRERVKAVIGDFLKRLKSLIDDLFGKHVFTDADVRDLLDEAWKAANREKATKPSAERHGGLDEVDESTAQPLVSLAAVRRALEARGVPAEAIAAMSRDQLRAEQAKLRARSEPTPAQTEALGVPSADGKTTAINKATVAEERAMKQKAAIEHDLKQSDPQVWKEAADTLARDPEAGIDLARSLAIKPRPITATEDAMLILDKTRIVNQLNDAYEQSAKAVDRGDGATQLALVSRIDRLEAQLEQNQRASDLAGYHQGAGLRFRRMAANEDYSMAGLIARGKSKAARPLDSAERERLQGMAKDIAAREKALEAREAALRQNRRQAQPVDKQKAARARFDDLAAQLKAISQKDHLKPGCVV